MTSVLSIVWQTKFEVIASWLFSNTLAAERLAVSFQAVLHPNIKTRPSLPYMSIAANFPAASLFLYPSIQLLLTAIATFALWLVG